MQDIFSKRARDDKVSYTIAAQFTKFATQLPLIKQLKGSKALHFLRNFAALNRYLCHAVTSPAAPRESLFRCTVVVCNISRPVACCMQDTFARANALGQARCTTIGYLVYNAACFI